MIKCALYISKFFPQWLLICWAELRKLKRHIHHTSCLAATSPCFSWTLCLFVALEVGNHSVIPKCHLAVCRALRRAVSGSVPHSCCQNRLVMSELEKHFTRWSVLQPSLGSCCLPQHTIQTAPTSTQTYDPKRFKWHRKSDHCRE